MDVFLTGATGFIGSAVAEALRCGGHEVVGLARSDVSARRLEARGYSTSRGDLADLEHLARTARRADAVIHVGATGDGEEAGVDAAATEALLKALEGTGKPFVYTSGVWVLGDTDDADADENAPVNPAALVAWRPQIERRVLEAPGLRGIVIRPALVYGRGGGIPAMLVDSGRTLGIVRYVGSGEQRWPFVHVDELADLYVRAVEASPSALLHAAHGPSYRARDVAEAASRAAGVPGRVAAWPLEEARRELGAFADALALDQQVSSARARRLLGWAPQAPSVLHELNEGSYARESPVVTS